jgi:hypothetical protein
MLQKNHIYKGKVLFLYHTGVLYRKVKNQAPCCLVRGPWYFFPKAWAFGRKEGERTEVLGPWPGLNAHVRARAHGAWTGGQLLTVEGAGIKDHGPGFLL